jgi:hypothetical protein
MDQSETQTLLAGVRDLGQSVYETSNIHFDQDTVFVVPAEDPLFVSYGSYSDIENIVSDDEFYPTWIYGPTGVGKSMMVEQACARTGKLFGSVSVTEETDEDSLLGGLRLMNGNTVPFFGPVTMAALMGARCCLEEKDLGTHKILCLQRVLEGKPFLIKRLGKLIHPKSGFNIVATANTSGRGDEEGQYHGTRPQNIAMLNRYCDFYYHNYPPKDVEKSILLRVLQTQGLTGPRDDQFADMLVEWAKKIRDAKDQSVDDIKEVISPRNLVQICRGYRKHGRDRLKAVTNNLNRYDLVTRTSLISFYQAIDANATATPQRKASQTSRRGKDPETKF